MIDMKFTELWEMAQHDLMENISTWDSFFEEWHIEKTDERQKNMMRDFVRAFGTIVAFYGNDIEKAEKDMLDYFDYCHKNWHTNKEN